MVRNRLQPTVFVDTVPELAAERRGRRDPQYLDLEGAEAVEAVEVDWILS